MLNLFLPVNAVLDAPPSIRDIRYLPVTTPVKGITYINDKNEFTLTCVADGHPEPVKRWYKDGVLIPEGESRLPGECVRVAFDNVSGVLTLLPSGCDRDGYNAALAGEFQCRATNELGTAISNVTKIQIAYINLRSEAENHKFQVVREGGSTKMVCAEIVSQPEADYKQYWHFRSSQSEAAWVPVDLNDRVWAHGNTLILLRVTPGDAGQYRCQGHNKIARDEIWVEHSLWNIEVDNSRLTADDDVQVIKNLLPSETGGVLAKTEGEYAVLKCFVDEQPDVNITWLVAVNQRCQGDLSPGLRFRPIQTEDGKLFKDGRVLVLANVKPRQQGCYRCQASSLYYQGTYVKTTYVEVAQPATVSISHPGDNKQQFRCEVSGQPNASIRWFLNDTEFNAETHVNWRLSGDGTAISATDLDTGVLSCRANWDQSDVIASVLLGPPIPEVGEASTDDDSYQRSPKFMTTLPATNASRS